MVEFATAFFHIPVHGEDGQSIEFSNGTCTLEYTSKLFGLVDDFSKLQVQHNQSVAGAMQWGMDGDLNERCTSAQLERVDVVAAPLERR